MTPTLQFTGCEIHLEGAFSQASIAIAAKPGRLEQVADTIRSYLASWNCTPIQAATLLGKCGFVGTQLQGRVLRFADRPLSQRQYNKSSDMSLDLPARI